LSNDAATDELIETLAAGLERERSLVYFRTLWATNIAVLIGLAVWIFFDGKFPPTAGALRAIGQAIGEHGNAPPNIAAQLGYRPAVLGGALLIGVGSLFGIFMGLFVGARVHRRLRSWLAFTMLVAAWLTIFVAWREFAWQGQRVRLRASLSEFDAIGATLRDHWPTTDGELAGFGSYMAYPQGKPRMLLMLNSDTTPAISAVERADDGTLGFELRGDQSGAWLEWHPPGSTPRAFVGGLEREYEINRTAPLGGGWYLVRYR
jgi:hypothetical protein